MTSEISEMMRWVVYVLRHLQQASYHCGDPVNHQDPHALDSRRGATEGIEPERVAVLGQIGDVQRGRGQK